MPAEPYAPIYSFQAVPGYFADYAELAKQDPEFLATTLPQFGLLDKDYETPATAGTGASDERPWARFARHVRHLNAQASSSTKYKVLFLTRHGFGWHNYQERKVGTKAWDEHWAKLNGADGIAWMDADLNPEGIQQAKELGRIWARAFADEGLPRLESIYTSPLARCLETTALSFRPAYEAQVWPLRVTVKEGLRETIIEHTCDRRQSRAWIAEHYPDYTIEAGFTHADELWAPGKWETRADHAARKQRALDEIFALDSQDFVALTIHSGAISAVLDVLHHAPFKVRQGSCLALLVRADKV